LLSSRTTSLSSGKGMRKLLYINEMIWYQSYDHV